MNTKDSYITIKNYKEPLIEVKNGFGYYGAIEVTTDGEYIRCHICGKLFYDLGSHARQAHKTPVSKYKEQFQLQATTALISEKERNNRKQRTIDWLKTLSDEEKKNYRLRCAEKIKKFHERKHKMRGKESLEAKNKKGTCPQQLIEKIKETAKALDKTPTLAEFIDFTGGQRFKHLVLKVYGTWNNALRIANLKSGTKRIGKYKKYSREELLEYLAIFSQENNKLPTATDAKRGLIPNDKTYKRWFGSLAIARQEAECERFIR